MNPHSTPEESLSTGTPEQAQRHHTDKRAKPRSDAAGRGAGLPARAPQLEREPTGEPLTAKDASIKGSLRLPHERDEDTDMTEPAVQPQIRQAAEDLAHGLKDTSRANESDQAYHRLHEGAEPPARPTTPPHSPGKD